MPELPEVEIVKRGLERLIVGRVISDIQCLDSPKSLPVRQRDIETRVQGSAVRSVRRRAKLLFIALSSGYTLIIHLKMTGQVVYRGDHSFGAGHPNDSLVGSLPDRSTRVIITFRDGSRLFFNDQRKFGWIKLYRDDEIAQVISRLGPEPLDDSLAQAEFIARMRRRSGTTVKAALLDQSVIAGVGNIYADESLWAAQIHPRCKVREITDEKLGNLLNEVKHVLELAIEKGGSTDKNYVDAEGRRGSYLSFARVFRREGQPCMRCSAMIMKIRVAGRGTHVCPSCQRAIG